MRSHMNAVARVSLFERFGGIVFFRADAGTKKKKKDTVKTTNSLNLNLKVMSFKQPFCGGAPFPPMVQNPDHQAEVLLGGLEPQSGSERPKRATYKMIVF